jgi:CheY-like chemotaxis protein
VDSKLGKGSTFYFTSVFKLGKTPPERDGKLEPEALRNLPVLIVDDNATNRRILQEMLDNWRMIPSTADRGSSALQNMERARDAGKPFPLVLLDAHMPEMDGFALAERIRRTPGLAGSAIMMLTSDRQLGDVSRCRELGISISLVKPIMHSELLEAVLLALDGRVPSGSGKQAPPEPPRTDDRRWHVLLAEDNVVNQKVALSILQKRGHTAVVASNGREVLEILEKCNYEGFDAVLMDIQMPEMDGFEATAAIRARGKAHGTHIPIIAMTAHAMMGDCERCLDAGMDGYVSKPIQVADLMTELRKHTRGILVS